MKALFAVLAIFISPALAFGDTIGPSTGCANSACLGNNYTLSRYSGDQLSIHYIIDSKGFRNTDVEYTDSIDNDVGTDGIYPHRSSGAVHKSHKEKSKGCKGKRARFGCTQVPALRDTPLGTLASETDVWKFLLTTDGLDIREDMDGIDGHGKRDSQDDWGNFENDNPGHSPKGADGSLGATAVPESSSLLMLATGPLIVGGMLRKFAP